uniref:HTH psq-type domain-containing protein n=1 Tax=Rhodnius prolixus TaxID=13249 RepID=T1I2I7_RHOPR
MAMDVSNGIPKAMVEAVKAVRKKKEMEYKTAAKTFQVPRATLKDYVQSSLEPIEILADQQFCQKSSSKCLQNTA